MCIFNGAFALWVSGWVGKEAPSDLILIVTAEFYRHGSVCKCWDKAVQLWSRLRGEEREAPLGWILPVWLLGCLASRLAEDEYCMVLCSRGWWLVRVGVGPTACQLLSLSLLVSNPVSLRDYIQSSDKLYKHKLHVKTICVLVFGSWRQNPFFFFIILCWSANINIWLEIWKTVERLNWLNLSSELFIFCCIYNSSVSWIGCLLDDNVFKSLVVGVSSVWTVCQNGEMHYQI